ncbi:urea amidolyase family protein [Agrococcus versicolor]|uniref:Urea amidolyase family protein n=1 Tax=Agrococcus versicolor TaxID=501482 RepID=A0ABN3AQ73_9MICO
MTRVRVAGEAALLLEAADLDEAVRLLPRLREAAIAGVTELVPGARTILVRFDPRVVAERDLAARLTAVEPVAHPPAGGALVTIPVRYDGQDLDDVAALLGVTTDAVVARHVGATWRVAFTGFAPGFAYLVADGAAPGLEVPRRASPRPRIPAGSVGLAGAFSGVYPREGPGGWQLLGRTDARMWDLERDEPALLAPGATVRFARAPRERLAVSGPSSRATGPSARHAASTHALEVVRPGVRLLAQDLGRPGLAALGVGRSGVADRAALRTANRAVGNLAHVAALEAAGGGVVLRARGASVVAIAGGRCDATVVGRAGTGVVAHGEPAALDDGDELRLGTIRTGARVVVAVRGGIALEPVLGSLSTDTLAGLGPAPLAAGDVVPLHGPAAAPHAVDPVPEQRGELPAAGDEVELRIVLGPRADWLAPAAIAMLTTHPWEVTTTSDRVGLRLAGPALERGRVDELPSEGVVAGAIQVPPDGRPVLFLVDHPLTGGYPVAAVVVDADLDLAGQVPPGARIRLRVHDPSIGAPA